VFGLTLALSDGSPRRLAQDQSGGPSHDRTLERSRSQDGEMGRRDYVKLYYVHSQTAVTSQSSIVPGFAGAGDGVREAQRKQGLGRQEQDGWLVCAERL